MPSKYDKIALNSPFIDRRVKLLPCQREMVLYWTDQGLSQRKIAKMFNVSRRLITMIQDPKKKERNLEMRELRGGSKAYYKGGKEWAETMRRHRAHKKGVFDNFKNVNLILKKEL
jgi:transposase